MQGEEDKQQTNDSQPPAPDSVIRPGDQSVQPSPVPAQPETISEQPALTTQVDDPNEQSFTSQTTEDNYDGDGLDWSGPEFVSHDKSSSWYLIGIAITLVLAAAMYLLADNIISSVTIIIVFGLLIVYGLRKPEQINYSLNAKGIEIGNKHFSYDNFRSFTVSEEGAFLSITLLPLRRFAPPAGLYYQGVDDEQILVEYLSDRLPMEQHKPDIIESLMLRIRF